jgi:hypothetical protein
MEHVAKELEAWGAPPRIAPSDESLSLLRDRVRPVVRAQLDADRALRDHQPYVLKRLGQIEERLWPLGQVVEEVTGLQPQYGAWSLFTDCPEMNRLLPDSGVVYRHHIALMVKCPRVNADRVRTVDLLSGVVISAMSDSTLQLVAAHQIQIAASAHKQTWVETDAVARESALEQRSIDTLLDHLKENLGRALECYGEAVDTGRV